MSREVHVQFCERVGVKLPCATHLITSGQANLVFLARELLREPYWTIKAQQVLDEEPGWPVQYGYVVKRRAKPRMRTMTTAIPAAADTKF